MEKLTQDLLQKLFHYNRSTGIFGWRVKKPGVKQTDNVTTLCAQGYKVVTLNRKRYYVHRLIWILETGKNADGFIDHKNRDKSDNRFKNLRVVSKSQNEHNTVKRVSNKTGYKNISYYKTSSSYVAEYMLNGRRYKKYLKAEYGDLSAVEALLKWLDSSKNTTFNGTYLGGV